MAVLSPSALITATFESPSATFNSNIWFNAESILASILSLTGAFAIYVVLYLGFGYLFLSPEEMQGYFNISIVYKYIYTLAISLILFPFFRSVYQLQVA